MESFVRHLEMRNTPTDYDTFRWEINPNILPLPAVILLIVASRGFIFWCFNILCIPIVLAKARFILFGSKSTPDSLDERDYRYQAHGTNNNNILEVSGN